MRETLVLTWWFARQLIAGDAITGRSVDWQMEAATADTIHTAHREGMYPVAEDSIEGLVSPSIYSGVERDVQPEFQQGSWTPACK